MTQLNFGFERHTSFENVEKLPARHQDILKVLMGNHRGKANVIDSYKLAVKVRMVPTKTNQQIRKACKELLAAGYPVVSCQKGFYIAQTYPELDEYRKNIQSRMQGLQRTWRDLNAIIEDFAKKDGFNNTI